jgi:purine nucleosidase
MSMPRTFLIDTDTASDDAFALIMAVRAPDVCVAAITVVSGNVPLRQGVINALYTCELCGRDDVPVYAGADRPLRRAPAHAQWFHGADGMGDMNYPAPSRSPEPAHAVDAMIEIIRANPGIELVTLGPLTNVALALQRAPDIARNVLAVAGGCFRGSLCRRLRTCRHIFAPC